MKLNIFIYVDALPLDSINEELTPFLYKLKAESELFVLDNILGYSFAIQSTLLSGKMPSETGHWMPYFRFPNKRSLIKVLSSIGRKIDFNQKLPFPLKILRWGFMEKLVLETGAKTSGIPWKLIDEFCMYPYYYMNELSFFDEFKRELHEHWGTDLEYFGPPIHKNPVNETVLFLKTLLNPQNGSSTDKLIIVYIDTLDALGHNHGVNSVTWKNAVVTVDKKLQLLYNLLKNNFSDFKLQIFSDHGMSEIKQTIDILSYLHVNGVNLGTDAVVFVDATLVMVWVEDKSRKPLILSLFRKLGQDKVVVFDRELDSEVLQKYGVLFDDCLYGDIIVQTKPGYMFFPNFYSDLAPFKATHGFLPEEKDQLSFLISSSSDGKKSDFKPKHIKDLRQYLLSLLDC